jgi:hypothetical protein
MSASMSVYGLSGSLAPVLSSKDQVGVVAGHVHKQGCTQRSHLQESIQQDWGVVCHHTLTVGFTQCYPFVSLFPDNLRNHRKRL